MPYILQVKGASQQVIIRVNVAGIKMYFILNGINIYFYLRSCKQVYVKLRQAQCAAKKSSLNECLPVNWPLLIE